MTDVDERLAQLSLMSRAFMEHVPHNRALGIECFDLGDHEARMRLPYSPQIVGNPETGVIHGGAITSLLDACCGAAVFMSLERPMPIATLDLRIDYHKPASPSRAVTAHATCYKVTRNIAFVRCVAYHDDPADLIASAAGTFMLATKSGQGSGSRADQQGAANGQRETSS